MPMLPPRPGPSGRCSCAARCHEGLKDWDTAELWIRRATEHTRLELVGLVRVLQTHGPRRRRSGTRLDGGALKEVQGRPDLADPRIAAYFYWSIRRSRRPGTQ